MCDEKKVIFLILLVLLFFSACNNDEILYQSKLDIPKNIWNKDKAAVFKIPVSDSLSFYDIIIDISNDNEYRYSNIWLFLTLKSNNFFSKDTLEVILADAKGKWFGKKSGKNWEYRFFFKRNVRFSTKGKLTFEIFQGMRKDNLSGISSIGIEILKSKTINTEISGKK